MRIGQECCAWAKLTSSFGIWWGQRYAHVQYFEKIALLAHVLAKSKGHFRDDCGLQWTTAMMFSFEYVIFPEIPKTEDRMFAQWFTWIVKTYGLTPLAGSGLKTEGEHLKIWKGVCSYARTSSNILKYVSWNK